MNVLRIMGMLSGLETFLLTVSLIAGLFQCFFGYRFVKFWITLIGFILGFAAGLGVSSLFIESRVIRYAVCVAAGMLIGFLSFKLYKAGVFIFIGLIGALICAAALYSSELPYYIILPVCLIVFIVCGILAVKFQKPVIIVITSVSGAAVTSRALTSMVDELGSVSYYPLLVFLGFAAAGILLQFISNRSG